MKKVLASTALVGLLIASGFAEIEETVSGTNEFSVASFDLSELYEKYNMTANRMEEFLLARKILVSLHMYSGAFDEKLKMKVGESKFTDVISDEQKEIVDIIIGGIEDIACVDIKGGMGEECTWEDLYGSDRDNKEWTRRSQMGDVLMKLRDGSISLDAKLNYLDAIYETYELFIKDGRAFIAEYVLQELANKGKLDNKSEECGPVFRGVSLCDRVVFEEEQSEKVVKDEVEEEVVMVEQAVILDGQDESEVVEVVEPSAGDFGGGVSDGGVEGTW